MNVCIVGAGYVGLVTGACLCSFGHIVKCVDTNSSKIESLNKMEIPIYEPGLSDLVKRGMISKKLFFTTNLESGMKDADIIMLAVCTPNLNGNTDLSFIMNASRECSQFLVDGMTVVIKSTVPVGTSETIYNLINELRPDIKNKIDVVSNPEFLREGDAVNDFMSPDRMIIGAKNEKSKEVLTNLYRPLYLSKIPMVFTDNKTAELIKYASNAFLATKITFINQISNLCEKIGANIENVSEAMGLDHRIGNKFLQVSPGFGGSCFPKDTEALVEIGKKENINLTIVSSVVEENKKRKKYLAERVVEALKERDIDLNNSKVAILGLTFKPNTDDLRNAPSIDFCEVFHKYGIKVTAYDPVYYKNSPYMEKISEFIDGITIKESWEDAIDDVDACIILTEWNEFRAMDLKLLRAKMKKHRNKNYRKQVNFPPLLFDYRNIYQIKDIAEFEYHSLGRPLQSK